MYYSKKDIKGLVKKIIREDLLNEAISIIEACPDEYLSSIRMYANKHLPNNKNSFGNLLCLELDFLKSKLEYFGKIPKVESEIGIAKEYIVDLIGKWRDEKLDGILPD